MTIQSARIYFRGVRVSGGSASLPDGLFVGEDEPSSPSNGDIWIDTNEEELAVWGYNDGWLQWGEVDPP